MTNGGTVSDMWNRGSRWSQVSAAAMAVVTTNRGQMRLTTLPCTRTTMPSQLVLS